jgi:hypothetical protein
VNLDPAREESQALANRDSGDRYSRVSVPVNRDDFAGIADTPGGCAFAAFLALKAVLRNQLTRKRDRLTSLDESPDLMRGTPGHLGYLVNRPDCTPEGMAHGGFVE